MGETSISTVERESADRQSEDLVLKHRSLSLFNTQSLVWYWTRSGGNWPHSVQTSMARQRCGLPMATLSTPQPIGGGGGGVNSACDLLLGRRYVTSVNISELFPASKLQSTFSVAFMCCRLSLGSIIKRFKRRQEKKKKKTLWRWEMEELQLIGL